MSATPNNPPPDENDAASEGSVHENPNAVGPSRLAVIIRELQRIMPRAAPKDLLAAAQVELAANPSMVDPRDNKDRSLNNAIKAIRDMAKLTMNNWHPWKRSLMINLQTVDNAIETITGAIDPGDPEYNFTLDLKLGAAINGALQLSGQRGVKHIVTKVSKSGKLAGSTLYLGLERKLTKQDAVDRGSLYAKINRMRMVNNDIEKLDTEINELWARATQLGMDLGEPMKISTLVRCISSNWSYTAIHDLMVANGNGDDYWKEEKQRLILYRRWSVVRLVVDLAYRP